MGKDFSSALIFGLEGILFVVRCKSSHFKVAKSLFN